MSKHMAASYMPNSMRMLLIMGKHKIPGIMIKIIYKIHHLSLQLILYM